MDEEQKPIHIQLAFDFEQRITPQDETEDCSIVPITRAREIRVGRQRKALMNSEFGRFFLDTFPKCGWILRSFDDMETAEFEIYAGMQRYPHRAPVIDRVFPALWSTEVLGTTGYTLYVCHIRELINRVGEGNEDLTVATDAEVIAGIHGVTLLSPTKRFVGQAYWYLFQKLLPLPAETLREDMDPFFALPTTEYEREQVFDFIEQVRKRVGSKLRQLSDVKRRSYGMSLTLRRFYTDHPKHRPPGFEYQLVVGGDA